jgi:hypothetical protein
MPAENGCDNKFTRLWRVLSGDKSSAIAQARYKRDTKGVPATRALASKVDHTVGRAFEVWLTAQGRTVE